MAQMHSHPRICMQIQSNIGLCKPKLYIVDFSSLENVAEHCWKNISRVTMNRDEPSRTCPICSWQSGAEINMPSVLVKQLLTD